MNILIFTLNQLEAHSRVVIRALPEARLIIFLIHRTIFEDSPMPLSVLLIQEMLCHIVPATDGYFQILIGTEIPIEIDMSDDILALYPPLALEIILITILPVFIYHTAIRTQALISSIGNAADDAFYPMEYFLIAQDERSFVEQPGCLDIVTVTLNVSLTFPLIIEEEVEMTSLLIEQLAGKDIQEIADALFQLFGLPHTIEIGIWLNDMQMSIHGTGTILILIRESHV